jgi:cytochrome b6-f complex iron-sulfur subunit
MRNRLRRRSFLRRWGGGWLLLAVGSGLSVAGCGNTGRGSAGNASAGGFENVGSLKLLEEEGRILQEQHSSEPLLVINPTPKYGTGKDAGKLLRPEKLAAVSPACPHQNCLVNWNKTHRAFVCPCHGSRFGADGKVLQGPAVQNLKQYDVEIRGEDIWVSSQVR